jgi:hypothetical protein
MKSNKYTPYEDEIILSSVKFYGDINTAYKNAAKRLSGRDLNSIKARHERLFKKDTDYKFVKLIKNNPTESQLLVSHFYWTKIPNLVVEEK